MGELRDFGMYFLLSPVFATAIGLAAGLIVALVVRGSASRLTSRPFMLLAFGYAAVGVVTFTFTADADGGRRVGPFVGTVLSFALVLALFVYIRRRRRRRERATPRQPDSRPRFLRRLRGSAPVSGVGSGAGGRPGIGPGDGGYTGIGGGTGTGTGIGTGSGTGANAGRVGLGRGTGWTRGLPRPSARPPGQLPPSGTGTGTAGRPGWDDPRALGRGGFSPGGSEPDDDGGPDDEPPHGPSPYHGPRAPR